jgi:hypothetical protein
MDTIISYLNLPKDKRKEAIINYHNKNLPLIKKTLGFLSPLEYHS